MEPTDFATPMLRAQQLVPNWSEQDLRQRMGKLQLEGQGLQNQQAQAQLDEQKRAQAQQQAFQADFTNAMLDPSAKSFASLLGRHPQFQKQTKEAWDALSTEKQTGDLRDMSSIYAAGQNGKYDLAASILKRRIDAEKEAGQPPDPTDQSIYEALTSGDATQQKAALGVVGTHVAAIVGPDKFSSTLEVLSKGGDSYTLAPGSKRFDATGKLIAEAPFAPQYRSVGQGDTLVEVGGEGGGQGSGASGGSPGSTSSAPRSVRNNNPGNIEDSAFAKSQPGYKGTDGRFAVFETPQAGAAAQGALLGSYIDRGFNTVGKIINRWAPPSDNNNTGSYVAQVAKALNVSPSDTLTKAAIPKLQAAIAAVEGGPGASSGVPAPGGARVVAQGQPKAGYRLLTPQENAAQGLDPNVRYQVGPEGQITALGGQDKSQGQLKPTPQAPAKSILENHSTLREIDRAIALVKSRPKSFGIGTGMLGDQFTQWNDPDGKGPRAAIGKIGGKIIHDISGAAVTMSESPRFQPYVPVVTDNADTIVKKLQQMRDLAAADVADLETAWGPENGYRGVKLSGKPTAAGGRPAPQKPAAAGGFKILAVRPK